MDTNNTPTQPDDTQTKTTSEQSTTNNEQSTTDQSSKTDPSEPTKNTLMAALSYIGPLVLVPYLTVAKDDSFVKFHVRQGLVLLVIEVAVWALGMIWWMIWPIYSIINLVTFILSIIGIVHAVKGHEKALPIIGKFGSQFKV